MADDVKIKINILTEGSDEAERALNKMEKGLGKLSGAATAASAAIAGPLALAFNRATKNIEECQDANKDLQQSFNHISEVLGRALIPVVEKIADAVQEAANFIEKFGKANIEAAVQVAAGVAAMLAAFAGIAKGVQIFLEVREAIMKVSLVLGGPLTLAIGAIILLATAFYTAWTTNAYGFRDKLTEAFETVKTYVMEIIDTLEKYWNRFMRKVDQIRGKRPEAGEMGWDPDALIKATNAMHAEPGYDGTRNLGTIGAIDLTKDIEKIRSANEEAFKNKFANFQAGPTGANAGRAAFAAVEAADKARLEAMRAESKALEENEMAFFDLTSEMTDVAREFGNLATASQEAKNAMHFQAAMGGVNALASHSKAGGAVSSLTQQGGDIWTKLIGVIVELLSNTKSFARSMKTIDYMFNSLSSVLDPIVESLEMVSVVSNVVLVPIFKVLGTIVGFVNDVLLTLVLSIYKSIVVPIMAFGALINEIASFIDKLFGGNGKAAHEEAVRLKAEAEKLGNMSLDDFKKELNRLADEQAQAADAYDEATTAVEGFSEALTNVPTGFKVAAARYNAIDPEGGGGGMSPGDLSTGGGNDGGTTIIVMGNVYDSDEFAKEVENATAKRNYNKRSKWGDEY